MCEKCKYYKYSDVETWDHLIYKNFQLYQRQCMKCKELFPWLAESQFKERSYVKR